MGIDPKTATYEQLEQWVKDNPTIISKKSIRNIKICLTNNCNVTILIKIWGGAICYGYVAILRSMFPKGKRYIIQYYNQFYGEVRNLSVEWYDNEFYVLDYKFD